MFKLYFVVRKLIEIYCSNYTHHKFKMILLTWSLLIMISVNSNLSPISRSWILFLFCSYPDLLISAYFCAWYVGVNIFASRIFIPTLLFFKCLFLHYLILSKLSFQSGLFVPERRRDSVDVFLKAAGYLDYAVKHVLPQIPPELRFMHLSYQQYFQPEPS